MDKKLFYISVDGCTDWLSVDKGNDGKYLSYPFYCYSIKSNKTREIATIDNPLVQLYLKIFDLKMIEQHAYLETSDDSESNKLVNFYDWIITEADETKSICKLEDFETYYEPVG